MIVVGGRTKRGIVGDVHIFTFATQNWTEERDVGLDARMHHRSFFYEKWLVLIGGEGPAGDSNMVWVDTDLWSEGLVREHGNTPFGISRFAMVQIAETTLLIFGGTDAGTRSPFAASYILDLQPGNVQRGRLLPRPPRPVIPDEDASDDGERVGITLQRHGSLCAGSPATTGGSDSADSPVETRIRFTSTAGIPKRIAPTAPLRSSTSVAPIKPPPLAVALESAPVRIHEKQASMATLPTFDQSSSTRISPASQDAFLASIGADISHLTQFEQTSTRMKLRRLMQLLKENRKLQVSVEQRLVQTGGEVPPGAPYFLKLINERTEEIIITRVSTSDSVADLRRITAQKVRRNAELVVVTGYDGGREPLDEKTLKVWQRNVLSRSAFALTLIAI
jgi:hypothetical protein